MLSDHRQKSLLKYGLLVVSLFILFYAGIRYFGDNSKANFFRKYDLAYPENIETTGNVKEVTLVAEKSELQLLDGNPVEVWTYNGQVPGPEIRVTKGDTLKINFTNNLPQETTIHFHGIRVPNAMDGVPGVTQEPIKPGETFVYEFAPKDAGTFWYHPHVRGSEQVERGLYGVIVVEDPDEPKYDQDTVVVLDDWRIDQSGQIDPNFNTGGDLMHDGRWGNIVTTNGMLNYKVTAKAGGRLRLRLVNTSNARVYKLDFGSLDVNGIAVDGMLVKEPFYAQGFEIAPGNRIDVDVTIPQLSQNKTYFIRDTFSRQVNTLMSISLDGAVSEVQTFKAPVAGIFPDWSSANGRQIDHEYILDARRGGQYGIQWTINGYAYPDYEPITLKKGEFNVIRFTNQSSRLHPMHLHGQFFKVLSRNGQLVDEPYLRDTVLIKSKEVVDIGIVPLDEGTWVSHCHVLEHAEAGMLTVVKVE
jgi:FtsP/CotA-like multicopper oxidase with cupredoxin domain